MLTKGVWELNPFDRGVDPHKVLVATTWPLMSDYSEPGANDFRRRLAVRLEREPGVAAVAFAASAPNQEPSQRVLNTGSPLLPKQETVTIRGNSVGPDYFRALGIDIWPGQEPLGQMLRVGGPKGKDHEVIGVVRNTAYEKTGNGYGPYVYLPWNGANYLTVLLRTERAAEMHADTVRRAVAALDPEMPITRLDVLADRLTGERGMGLRVRAWGCGSLG